MATVDQITSAALTFAALGATVKIVESIGEAAPKRRKKSKKNSAFPKLREVI